MLIDGNKIRDDVKKELAQEASILGAVKMATILVGDNPVSEKYVRLKERFGQAIGVEVQSFEYEANITENDLLEEVQRIAGRADVDGVMVQLPLPKHLSADKILAVIPSEKDVDALTKEAVVLSPVTAAVKEILERNNFSVADKKVVVVGNGRLVGKPTSIWLATAGADVVVLDDEAKDISQETKKADLIILGAGVPALLKKEMIKDGVVIIDAGTSEEGGKLVGDADSLCQDKAALFTPVPGGVGPVTLAMIFKNLLILKKRQR